MASYRIKTIAPTFVLIHFDIAEKSTGTRSKVLRLLRRAGFVRHTDSVYYGYFSMKAMEAVRVIENAAGSHVVVVTPTFPDDQIKMMADQYEQRFTEQFVEANELLVEVEKAIVGEVLMKDKETGEMVEYTTKRIAEKIKYVTHLLEELRTAITRRKERGEETDYEGLEARLRQMDSYATDLDKKNDAKAKAEKLVSV